ncbi:MAG: hypothetical protein WC319_04535 [Candidatus Paceibacterota bacterium]|jgi:hypothetical protein
MRCSLKITAAVILVILSVYGAQIVTERTNLTEGVLFGLGFALFVTAIFIVCEKMKNFLDSFNKERILEKGGEV